MATPRPPVTPQTSAGMPTIEPNYDGAGLRVCIVAARWNSFVTEPLLDGAQGALAKNGVPGDAVTITWVPGAFEVPTAAQWAAQSGLFDAVICLGAVIRGETPHFDFVAGEAARGIADVARSTGVPVMFGVLTCDTADQALDRAGGAHGHKGEECALGAIEMANLRRALDKRE